MRSFLIILLILSSVFSFGKTNLDSLWRNWKDTDQPDSIRIRSLIKYSSYKYKSRRPDSAIYYADIGYKKARTKDLKELMARSLSLKGVATCIKGDYKKGMELFKEGLIIMEEIDHLKGKVDLLNNIANVYFFSGDFDQAIKIYSQCLEIHKKTNNDYGIASIQSQFGNVYGQLGQQKKSIACYEKSLAYFKKENHEKRYVKTLSNLGIAYKRIGEYKKALEVYDRALDIYKKMGDENGRTRALQSIANVYSRQGKYEKALEYYGQFLDYALEADHKFSIGMVYSNMAKVYRKQGNYTKAIKLYTNAIQIQEKIDDKNGLSRTQIGIGSLYGEQGKYEASLNYFKKALEIKKAIGDQEGVGVCLGNIGMLYEKQNDYEKALEHYQKSLEINKEIHRKIGISDLLNNIAGIHSSLGHFDIAEKKYQKALKLKMEVDNKPGIVTTLNNIGYNYFKKGNTTLAVKNCEKAFQLAKELGIIIQIKKSSKNLYAIYHEMGNAQKALKMYQTYIEVRDSIQSEKNQRELIRQEYKYEYEKKAYADSIKQSEEKKLSQAKIQAQQAKLKQEKTQRFALYGGVGLLLLFGGFMFNRFRVTKKQKNLIFRQKAEVEIQKSEAEHQKNLVQEKNTEILDSINYAKRLQEAILPPKKLVRKWLDQSFILYKPKDIVAGDFYWMETIDDTVYFAAADCTGHGVPGAMVSVVCSNALSKALIEEGITDPGKILDRTRELVIDRFGRSEEEIKDGMDIALCKLKLSSSGKGQLQYAGAHNPLWILRKGAEKVEEIKANKQPIGRYATSNPYTTHEVQLENGDSIYIFSDGFPDQFGGPKGKKYKSGKFKRFLLSIQDKNMEEQRKLISKEFEAWKGELEQLDDVCVIGVKV